MIGSQVSVLDNTIPRLILKPKPTGKRKKHRVMLYREHKPILVPIDESPEDKLIKVDDPGNIDDTGESSTKEEDGSDYGAGMGADVNTNEAGWLEEVDEVVEAVEADEVDEVVEADEVDEVDELEEDDDDDDDGEEEEEEDEDDEDEDTSTDGSDDGDDLCDFLVHDTSSDYDGEAEYQETFYSDEEDEEEYYYNDESAWSEDEGLSEGEDGAYFSENCEENV